MEIIIGNALSEQDVTQVVAGADGGPMMRLALLTLVCCRVPALTVGQRSSPACNDSGGLLPGPRPRRPVPNDVHCLFKHHERCGEARCPSTVRPHDYYRYGHSPWELARDPHKQVVVPMSHALSRTCTCVLLHLLLRRGRHIRIRQVLPRRLPGRSQGDIRLREGGSHRAREYLQRAVCPRASWAPSRRTGHGQVQSLTQGLLPRRIQCRSPVPTSPCSSFTLRPPTSTISRQCSSSPEVTANGMETQLVCGGRNR